MLERNRWSSVNREELKWAAVEREFGNHRDVDDERSRPQEPKARQEFHASIRSVRHTRFAVHWPRELMHDAQVYRAYLKDAERLREDGAFIRRVVLDHELKREYQQFPGVPRALQRLMLLDAILENPESIWMSSSAEKVDSQAVFQLLVSP